MRTRCSLAVFQAAVEQVQQGCWGDFQTQFHAHSPSKHVPYIHVQAQTCSLICIPLKNNSFSLVLHRGGFIFAALTCWIHVERKWAALSLHQQWKLSSEISSFMGKLFIAWDHYMSIKGNNLYIPSALYALDSVGSNNLNVHIWTDTQRQHKSQSRVHPSVDGVTCCVASLVSQPIYNFMPPAQGLVNSSAGTDLCCYELKWLITQGFLMWITWSWLRIETLI